MRQRATIKDVAQRAGCGVATVSRVLNNTGPASADIRQRVLDAVEVLDFQFSEVGRSLRSSMTRTIGCVVPSLANPVYADAVQGAQEAFLNAGYQTLLVCTNYSPEIELEAIRTLIAKQVDGFVLTVSDVETSEGLRYIEKRHVPYSLLFNTAPSDQISWSVADHSAAKTVAAAFAENNHTHTGFLALKFKSSDRARQRYQGFVDGCAEQGMAEPALLETDENNQDLTDILRIFLQKNPNISGIFASNDFLALAIIRHARLLGLDVPKDLSIVGFDGIGVGSMVEPSLATIVTDPGLLGAGAGKSVLSRINGVPLTEFHDPELSFSFRSGGSLAPLFAERRDDGKNMPFPPSYDPPQTDTQIQQERSR